MKLIIFLKREFWTNHCENSFRDEKLWNIDYEEMIDWFIDWCKPILKY